MELILASNNKSKAKEIKEILGKEYIVHTLLDLDNKNIPQVEEDQDTFKGNALKKAKVITEIFNLPTISDDSGIEIQALNNWPGVYTKRLDKTGIGENMSSVERNGYILEKAKDIQDRTVFWKTAIAIYFPNGKFKVFEGILEGELAYEIDGDNGFAFDSIFKVKGTDKTIACLSLEEKNSISPRKIALEQLKEYLSSYIKK